MAHFGGQSPGNNGTVRRKSFERQQRNQNDHSPLATRDYAPECYTARAPRHRLLFGKLKLCDTATVTFQTDFQPSQSIMRDRAGLGSHLLCELGDNGGTAIARECDSWGLLFIGAKLHL